LRFAASCLTVSSPFLLSLAACSSQVPAQNGTDAPASVETDAALAAGDDTPSISLTSKVPGIALVSMAKLPVHHGKVENGNFCSELVMSPKSAAARQVHDAGWVVTGQTSVGGYDIVSFAGGLEPGTSGNCTLENGNIALFKDGTMRALAYGQNPAALAIGSIRAGENGLKILNGDFLHETSAIISIAGDGSVLLAPLPKKEAVCKGAAAVPNIQEMPINKARDLLIKAGWKPVPNAEPIREEEDWRAYDLVQAGVVEAGSCSGTGMAYCSFGYTGPAGDLSVITVGDGEWPIVSRYGVECK
jgi:hypothetical protein